MIGFNTYNARKYVDGLQLFGIKCSRRDRGGIEDFELEIIIFNRAITLTYMRYI